jgi:ribonuclease HI
MKLTIHSDGGSRGNPGKAAAAFVVTDENDVVIFEWKKYLGVKTNNQAEYTALVMAWKWLLQYEKLLEVETVEHKVDSELMFHQLAGRYKVKSPDLVPFVEKAKELQKQLPCTVAVIHVRREFNKEADYLVNKALDEISEK